MEDRYLVEFTESVNNYKYIEIDTHAYLNNIDDLNKTLKFVFSQAQNYEDIENYLEDEGVKIIKDERGNMFRGNAYTITFFLDDCRFLKVPLPKKLLPMPEYDKVEDAMRAASASKSNFETAVDEFCDKLKNTLIEKNKNYGNSFEKSYQKRGNVALLLRFDDKFGRFEQLLESESQGTADESMQDTLLDIAGYSMLTSYVLRKKANK